MSEQPVNPKSPASTWELLDRIADIFSQSLSIAQRLPAIIDLIIETLDVDGVWIVTVAPLSPFACGVVRTPLTIAPDAKVILIDDAPPVADGYFADTVVGQVMAAQVPEFWRPCADKLSFSDGDLGDRLFYTFEIVPAAVVPLLADYTAVGALVIGRKAPAENSFDSATQHFLTYLGRSIGQSLQLHHLKRRTQQHAESLLAMNSIARTITSSLELDDVIQRTMAGINAVLDVEAGSLLLIDENSGELYFKITLSGEDKRFAPYRLEPGEGIAGWVLQRNTPAVINNVREDKRFSAKIDQAIGFKTRSVLCVPLMIHGKPIGVVEVLNKRRGPFSKDDQILLVSMVASLSIALKNAALYEDAQQRANINQVISQLVAAINAGHGLSETAKIIFKQTGRLFKFEHMSISLLDDSGEMVQQWRFGEYGCLKQPASVPLKDSRLAHIITTQQGYLESDLAKPKFHTQSFPDDEILRVDEVKSMAAVPLVTKSKPYGSLTIGSHVRHNYDVRELEMLEQLAPQFAVAVEKALLIESMEQRTAELQLLNRLGEMLISTTKIDLIFETALNMVPRIIPSDVHGIVIAVEDGLYIGVAVPFDFKRVSDITRKLVDIYAELREDDSPVNIIDCRTIAGNMPVSPNWQPDFVISLPILTRRGAQGVLYVASEKGDNFSNEVLRIFALIVSQISVAIENAHLFQEVEQERARLAAILTSSTDAVLVVDRSGRIVLDNPAAREVLGVQDSQKGRLLVESTTLESITRLFDGAMNGGKPTGEVILADGRTFYANLSPVSAGEAGVIGWVATMQDVSHFKELNQLKNDFVNTVSHDLRSPLSNILMAASLIREVGETNEDQQALLGLIEKRVRSMSHLIEDLLDVGKIEAGIEMEMEPCNLIDITEEVITTLLLEANQKNIQVTQSLDSNLPLVLANAVRIRQVFHNLISNAVKYTSNEGQVIVRAYAHQGEVRLQVTDTGAGIPPTDRPHVFEKFYRVSGEQAANVKGTGLGLAIAKGIVEKHHGRIWLESVVGEGTTFTVALPVPTATT